MWFRLPEGCGGITVEQQEFSPEFKDESGNRYFRAPDHFAPRILALKGFAIVDQPEGALADLPKADPLRDGAISELTRANEALKMENQNLRSDYNAVNAQKAALMGEKIELLAKLESAEAIAIGLREQMEDQGMVETVVPIKKAK